MQDCYSTEQVGKLWPAREIQLPPVLDGQAAKNGLCISQWLERNQGKTISSCKRYTEFKSWHLLTVLLDHTRPDYSPATRAEPHVGFTEPKIFTIRPFTQKVCNTSSRSPNSGHTALQTTVLTAVRRELAKEE